MFCTAIKPMDTSPLSTQFGIEAIAYFKWDKSMGITLRKLRTQKGLTMKQLSQKMALLGIDCSLDYLGTLEHGRVESLKTDKLLGIAHCLEVNLDSFYPDK